MATWGPSKRRTRLERRTYPARHGKQATKQATKHLPGSPWAHVAFGPPREGGRYEELVPTYATTTGTLHDTGPSGGTWSNLTAASQRNPNPKAGRAYNLLGQFSATCFYFGAALTDERERRSSVVERGAAIASENDATVPIGLIQSAIGGSQIEAWTPDSALGRCANESLNANGQAPPGRLYNGMVPPWGRPLAPSPSCRCAEPSPSCRCAEPSPSCRCAARRPAFASRRR